MFAAAPPLMPGLDPDQVEDQGARFLAAIVAVVEFGRPAPDSDQLALFETGMAEALIVSLATWIAYPPEPDDQHGVMLEKVICRLRAHVCNTRAPEAGQD